MRQNKKTRARAFGRDSFVENLENRTLLSGTVAVVVTAGNMTITGDAADNSIIIQDTGVGLFAITGTNNTSVTYSGTTYTAGTPANVTSADKDVTISMTLGGNDTVDAANPLKLIDASGTHYSLTYTSVGSAGNTSLFKSVAATGMVAMLDAPNPAQEVQDLAIDFVATGGTYTISVGTLTTPSLASGATASAIGNALDTLLGVPQEIQTLKIDNASTGGTFTITANGNTTTALNYNDSGATIATALDTALSVSGTAVVGTVGAGGTLTFTFPIAAGNVPLMTIDTSLLTGSTVTGVFSPNTEGTGGTVVNTDIATATSLTFTFPSYVGNLPLMTMDVTSLTGTTSALFAFNADGAAVGTAATGQIVLSDTPGVAPRGSITLTAQAVAGDRVTINDGAGNVRTYTAVSGAPAAGQFQIGTDMYATAANLATAINLANPVLGVGAVAAPQGTKEQQTLSPVGGASAGGTFTITYGTSTTTALAHNAGWAAVQTALRLLPGLGAVTVTGGSFGTNTAYTVTFPVSLGDVAPLVVTPTGMGGTTVSVGEGTKGVLPGTSEIQTVTPGVLASAGTYTLSYGGNTTTALAFGATTATVQTALRLLPGLSGIVVGGAALSVGAMNFTFAATMGDVSMITMGSTSLTPALGYTWVESTRGIAPASCKLTNDVMGAAGNQSVTVSTFSKPRMTAVGMSGGGETNVAAGDTVVLRDGVNPAKTFTFGANPTDVPIGATAAITADNLIAAINAVGGSLLITASTTTYDGTIDLLQDAAGLAGNTTITVAGAQLAKTNFLGGTNGTNILDGETILVNDGMNPAITFTARTAAPDATLHEFLIGGDDIASMANFVAAVNSTPLLDVTAVDNYDGSATLTNDVAGTFGNGSVGSEKLLATGTGVASVDMAGGAGYSIEALNVTATMGSGTNVMGIGAGGSGQSYIYGTLGYTGGAGNDSVAVMGAFIGGTMTVALAAGDTTTGDAFVMGDEGTVPSYVAGDASITQTTGLATITIRNKGTLASPMEFGGKLTIDPGVSASGIQVTTINNTKVDGQFIYGTATSADADTLNFTGSVDIGDLSTILLGAGANQFNTVGTQEVQTLTPDAAATAGTYTFTYAGQTTAPIAYNATLAQTQTALRLLPGCEGVVITGEKLAGVDEVQTLTPKAVATAGTYTLTYGGNTTAPLAFDATIGTVQTELRRFTSMQNIVVGGTSLDLGAMTFTFPNMGNVAAITIADGGVTPLTPTVASSPTAYVVTTTTPGGVTHPMIITFPAGAGDAEMLSATLGGLTGTTGASTLVETTKGSVFNFSSITGGAVTYTGLAGTDDVTLGGRVIFNGAATIGLGDGANTLTAGSVTADGTFTVNGGTGGDTIALGTTGSFFARGGVAVSPGAGTNGFQLDNADVASFTYTGLAGDDTLTIGATRFLDAGAFTVSTGDGTNILTMDNSVITGAVSYTGGIGADTTTIGAKSFDAKTTVALNLGAAGVTGVNVNTATVNGRSKALTYTGGSGADTLKLGTILGRGFVLDGLLTFTGGADANELDVDGSVRGITYSGGIDADIIKLGIGVNAKFTATAAVAITASDGANTTTIKNATIRGADASGNGLAYTGGTGVDTINIGQGGSVGLTVAKGVTISTGAAVDHVNIDNSVFCSTSGAFVLNTGLGDDIVNFDAGGTGSIFNRAVTICAGGTTGGTTPNFTTGGGNDVFNDSANTKYLGRTTATKVSFYGFRAAGTGNINGGGAGAGTILGTKLIAPLYS